MCYEGSESVQYERTNPEYHEHGMSTYVGQVKVCINGSYHEICDVGWDDLDAQVVCNYWFGSDYGKLLLKSTTELLYHLIIPVPIDSAYYMKVLYYKS